MRRIFSFILAVVLVFATCVPAFAYEMPQTIRVGLFFGSGSKSQYTITSNSGVIIRGGGETYITEDNAISEVKVMRDTQYHVCVKKGLTSPDEAWELVLELRKNGQDAFFMLSGKDFSVYSGSFSSEDEALLKKEEISALGYSAQISSPSSSGVLIYNGDKIWTGSLSSGIRIIPKDGIASIDGKAYRGLLEFYRDTKSDMAAVNVVNIEDYLKGVVPKEVSPSWNTEAIKAQAIVARTYAVTNMNKFQSYGINVDDSTQSQVYGGVSAEYDSTSLAVNETKGELVMYDGSPAEVFFFSSSGGKTESVENVWGGNAFPYLVSVDDPYENPVEASYANWEITLSKEDIKNKLSSSGIDIGEVLDIKTLEMSPAGRSLKTVIYGTSGEYTLTFEKCRGFFGLYSNCFTISREGASSPAMYLLGKGGSIFSYPDGLWQITNSGISMLNRPINVIGANGTKTYSESIGSGDFIFKGKGWGHAIGMSQWGAKGMADHGFSYDQIVTHYFPGTTIEDIG